MTADKNIIELQYKAPGIRVLSDVFLDYIRLGEIREMLSISDLMSHVHQFPISRTFGVAEPLARLEAAGWVEIRLESVGKLRRRIAMNDMVHPWHDSVHWTKEYVATLRYLRSLGRMYRSSGGHIEHHRHVMLRHPMLPDYLVWLFGLEGVHAPICSEAAIQVFAPGKTHDTATRLIDPLELAPYFDGHGPRFVSRNGIRHNVGYRWSQNRSFEAEGDYDSGGRDVYTVSFKMRKFQHRLLPKLNLPRTSALYSISKSQVSM